MTHKTYDALGRVHTLQVNSGETTTYDYDLQGKLSKVTVGTRVFDKAYTGGNEVPDTLTRKDGGATKSVTSYAYDSLYRLLSITNKKADNTTVITENAFTYNKAHMRDTETITNAVPPVLAKGTTNYTDNNVNQVDHTVVTPPGSVTRYYAYDYDGNMTSWTAGAWRRRCLASRCG